MPELILIFIFIVKNKNYKAKLKCLKYFVNKIYLTIYIFKIKI